VVEIVGTFLLVSVVNAAVDPQRAGAIIHISALGPLAIGMVRVVPAKGVRSSTSQLNLSQVSSLEPPEPPKLSYRVLSSPKSQRVEVLRGKFVITVDTELKALYLSVILTET
jgi:hypothetical protein